MSEGGGTSRPATGAMAGHPGESDRLRLFLALEPSLEAREALAALAAGLRQAAGSAAGLRFVAPPLLHLTVRFLGAVAGVRVEENRSSFRGDRGCNA